MWRTSFRTTVSAAFSIAQCVCVLALLVCKLAVFMCVMKLPFLYNPFSLFRIDTRNPTQLKTPLFQAFFKLVE